MTTPVKFPLLKYLTPLSMVALVVGSVLGFLTNTGILEPVGFEWIDAGVSVWIECVKIVALPLMLAYISAALLSRPDATGGKAGGLAFVLHVLLLASFGIIAVTIATLVIPHLRVEDVDLTMLSSTAATGADAPTNWLGQIAAFLGGNKLTTAANDNIVTALLVTVVLSLIAARGGERVVEPLKHIAAKTARLALLVIGGLLVFLPGVVFGFAYLFGADAGLDVGALLLVFVLLVCSILVILHVILLLIASHFGNIPMKKLLKGLAPVGLMAIGTRSSLACMPLTIETAREEFGLSEVVVSVVVPLSVAAFKLNKVASSTTGMLFMAYVYSVQLTPPEIASYLLVAALTSFGTPGLPSASTLKVLPMYVALGIPVEGYILLNVVDPITDLFKTTLNVAEDFTLAAVVDRILRR